MGAPLKEEPIFILMTELKEPRIYQSILEALSMGRNTLSQISSHVGFEDSRKVQPYLRKLEELTIIKRTLPALLKKPRRTRKIRYEIADQLFRFWYRFIFPNIDRLEMGDTHSIMKILVDSFNQYVSFEFERQATIAVSKLLKTTRFGKFWSKGEEIDFLGETKEGLLAGEFKWWNKKLGISILKELKKKCQKLSINASRYVLVSQSGFEKELFDEKDVTLITLDKNDGWKFLKQWLPDNPLDTKTILLHVYVISFTIRWFIFTISTVSRTIPLQGSTVSIPAGFFKPQSLPFRADDRIKKEVCNGRKVYGKTYREGYVS